MPVPPSALDALRAAVDQHPADVPLRLHLAAVLVEAGADEEALHHATAILDRRPDELTALGIAASCSERLGDQVRADAYHRLLTALGGPTPGTAASPAASAPPAPDVSSVVPETVDELLAGWAGTEPLAADPALGSAAVPEVALADVAGMSAVKRRLEMSFLGPARHPDLAAAARSG